jgi:hypothetical protein
VVAVSDSDASGAAADGVTLKTPYPFWLGVVQVTAVDVVADDGTLLNGIFILTPSVPVYIGGWAVLAGSATLTVANGVGTPVTVPATDTAGTALTYTITTRLNTPDGVNPPPVIGVTIPHTLGLTVDISALL